MNLISSLFKFLSDHPWLVLMAVSIGGVVVIWGLIWELTGEKEQYSTAREFRKCRKKRKWGEVLVVIGVGIETVVALSLAGKDIWESTQTASNIKQNAPLNQPITFVRANVLLFVRGTNAPSVDLANESHFVTLSLGNRDWVQKNHTVKLSLVCKAFETGWAADEMEFVLEFGPDAMPSPIGPSFNLTTNDTVRSADEWDFLLLDAFFLRNKSEIRSGSLSLVINTTVKHFNIPPQTAEMQYGRYDDIKLIGSPASNAFNVIVMPGPN